MKIFDNFLTHDEWDAIRIKTNGWNKWNIGNSIPSDMRIMPDQLDTQVYYFIYKDGCKECAVHSGWLRAILPLFKKLSISSLDDVLSIKINGNFCREKPYVSGWHTDFISDKENYMTGIYYLSTNNGKTLFKSGEEVESVENRMLVFPGKMEHTPMYQTDLAMRYVINLNWLDRT